MQYLTFTICTAGQTLEFNKEAEFYKIATPLGMTSKLGKKMLLAMRHSYPSWFNQFLMVIFEL